MKFKYGIGGTDRLLRNSRQGRWVLMPPQWLGSKQACAEEALSYCNDKGYDWLTEIRLRDNASGDVGANT